MGPWSRLTTIDKCYYNSGLLVDDDGTMYVSYIYNSTVWVAQLSSDAKTELKSQQVYSPPSTIAERNALHLPHHPANEEWVIKYSSPFGSYSVKALVQSVGPPVSGAGYPHQGGIVDTPSGQWYYMAFIDAYPGGPPITWGSDGFPSVTLPNGTWGTSYSDPVAAHPLAPLTVGMEPQPQIPPSSPPAVAVFVLNTATVTNDLYAARNTITHRILVPTSTATIKLNYANMKDGDRSGLAMLRDSSAWDGVKRDSGSFTVGYSRGLTINSDWSTNSAGTISASVSISDGAIWLRVTADITPGSGKHAKFYYSTNGKHEYFMGYRSVIFNHATSSLGGYVTVPLFLLDSGLGTTPSGVPSGTTSTTSKAPTTTTTSKITTATAGSGGCTATHYAQCGGQGWTGCTSCEAGTTCQYQNDWYSQCI
ncbi:hypothetical protein FRC04_001421 [Tulasnella sp. 424]|nr:hypothetical protein FRC04_001421 [Tulasnella sp. 424]